MPKPERAKLSTRKPADPAALDAFLQGKVAPPPPSSGPASGRVVHRRKDGREIRRTTILMPLDLAQRVDVFCARRGVDKTRIVQTALERYLDEQGEGLSMPRLRYARMPGHRGIEKMTHFQRGERLLLCPECP